MICNVVMVRVLATLILLVSCLHGHALPTPVVRGPLRVSRNAIIDGDGRSLELTGVNIASVDAAKDQTILFKVIRRRWNMNAVRIPVSVSRWRRDGDSYLSMVGRTVEAANEASLAVILVARDEEASLPSSDMVNFWQAAAGRLRTHTRVIFDLFDKPSAASIQGRSPTGRTAAEWEVWLNGGRTTDGQTVIGMRQLVEAVRSVGADQVVAVQAFADVFGFESFETRFWLSDQNVVYEVHPYFDRAKTAAERERTFGYLANRLHILAGEWGIPFQGANDSHEAFERSHSSCERKHLHERRHRCPNDG